MKNAGKGRSERGDVGSGNLSFREGRGAMMRNQ